MARPKSDKRAEIFAAAISVIAVQGLAAPTAAIAKAAGVANGSLFLQFPTKADLLNQLFIELKGEMASAALAADDGSPDIRDRLLQAWTNWLQWTVSSPQKRRVLAALEVSEDISPDSRKAGQKAMAGIAELVNQARQGGPMDNLPLSFVTRLVGALADATTETMISEPDKAPQHALAAFQAFWRMIHD